MFIPTAPGELVSLEYQTFFGKLLHINCIRSFLDLFRLLKKRKNEKGKTKKEK